MGMNSSLLSYELELAHYDAALADPKGIRITCPSRAAAIQLKGRLHYARKLTRDENAQTYEPAHPMHGKSEYDRVHVRLRDGDNGSAFLFLEHVTASLLVESLSEIDNA